MKKEMLTSATKPKGASSSPGERTKGRVYKHLDLNGFIHEARKVHGEKYDYSKVEYVNTHTKVAIICPIHGEFFQVVHSHLSGSGCPKCGKNRMVQKLYGRGHTEHSLPANAVVDIEGCSQTKCYKVWHNLFRRCGHLHNYIDCKVADEWLTFSNFKKFWDDNYHEGFQIDKDLLSNGKGRIYGPDTCCFLPVQLNTMLRRGKFVFSYGNRHYVNCCNNYLGSFDSYEQAFSAYKLFKESFIKQRAKEYFDKGEISEKIYNALMNYKVEVR